METKIDIVILIAVVLLVTVFAYVMWVAWTI